MSESTERIYALLVDANPVPDIGNLPTDSAHTPHLYVIDARSDKMQTQTPTIEKQGFPTEQPPRRRWIPAVAAAAVVAVAIGIAALALSGRGTELVAPATEISPEEVVAQVIEASNDRDVDALAALYDPEIVYTYDASLGGGSFTRDASGIEDVLALLEEVWATYNPIVTSYVVRNVDDGIVRTAEIVKLSSGSSGHIVMYEVSSNGLITLQEVVVRPQ